MPIGLRFPLIQTIYRKGFLGFVFGLLLVIGFRLPAIAQSPGINRAEITQILDSPQVFIQNKLAKVKDTASKGQRVRTGNARAQILFNTGAIGRLAANSVLTVGQQCARLRSGTLLVNGAMNGCTSSIVAGVRGTTYLLEVDGTGEARVKVLEGVVAVNQLPNPIPDEDNSEESTANKQLPPFLPSIPTPPIIPPSTTPTATPETPVTTPATSNESPSSSKGIVLHEGEKVSVRPDGTVGLIEKLSQEEFIQLLKGGLFNGFSIPLPGVGKIQQSFQRLFPGVPFPISIPGLRIPNIPAPPVQIPFPF